MSTAKGGEASGLPVVLHIFKAEPIYQRQQIPDLTVEFDRKLPPAEELEGVEDYSKVYHDEAVALLDAMSASCPAGLMDAILAELCRRKEEAS